MTDTAQDLLALWEGVINRLIFLEKRFVFRQDGLSLHPSELHVLMAVRSEPESNATRLAERLGVTKGAVSQVLKRLEGKGVIVKHVDSSQKNEVTVSFTPSGRKVLESFLAQRGATQQRFHAYLSSLSETEGRTLRRFLDQFGSFLPSGE
ncbi:MAG TPA: MarR family transcriptional regulator [Telmatospirillum sp.]|nr:MarR family transcriptional regulator [Telmatospirillum sp.]